MRSPPLTFGLTFEAVGEHRRRGEHLPLFVGRSGTDVYFSDAYKHARSAMIEAGYSWTDLAHERGQLEPAWWDHGVDVDLAALQAAVDAALAKGAEERAEKERAAEARRAEAEKRARAEVAEVKKLSAPIRAELDAMLLDRPWAFGRQHAEAVELSGIKDWTHHGMRCAERLIENAEMSIERAEKRLKRTPPAQWHARAADVIVREAALLACRYLSERDEDWASDANGVGWSQATSWVGHVLSERRILDQGAAGHALALLHVHRKQLTPELREVLFGVVPPPAPEPVPRLAL